MIFFFFFSHIDTHMPAHQHTITFSHTCTQRHMFGRNCQRAQYFTVLPVHISTQKLWQYIWETVSLSRKKIYWTELYGVLRATVFHFFLIKKINKEISQPVSKRVGVKTKEKKERKERERKKGTDKTRERSRKRQREGRQGGNTWCLKWRWHMGWFPLCLSRLSRDESDLTFHSLMWNTHQLRHMHTQTRSYESLIWLRWYRLSLEVQGNRVQSWVSQWSGEHFSTANNTTYL